MRRLLSCILLLMTLTKTMLACSCIPRHNGPMMTSYYNDYNHIFMGKVLKEQKDGYLFLVTEVFKGNIQDTMLCHKGDLGACIKELGMPDTNSKEYFWFIYTNDVQKNKFSVGICSRSHRSMFYADSTEFHQLDKFYGSPYSEMALLRLSKENFHLKEDINMLSERKERVKVTWWYVGFSLLMLLLGTFLGYKFFVLSGVASRR